MMPVITSLREKTAIEMIGYKDMNLALKLTFARIVLIPVFLVIYLLNFPFSNWVAWVVFSLAAFTDFLDGYIARKYQQASRAGAFLDPVADKLLVVIVLVCLLYRHSEGVLGLLLMLMVTIIIGREIIVCSLREFMALQNVSNAVSVKLSGKLKTTFQLIAMGFLIIYEPVWIIPTADIGYLLLAVASALTIYSLIQYCQSAMTALKSQ